MGGDESMLLSVALPWEDPEQGALAAEAVGEWRRARQAHARLVGASMARR